MGQYRLAPLVVPSRIEMDAIDRLVVAANVVAQVNEVEVICRHVILKNCALVLGPALSSRAIRKASHNGSLIRKKISRSVNIEAAASLFSIRSQFLDEGEE